MSFVIIDLLLKCWLWQKAIFIKNITKITRQYATHIFNIITLNYATIHSAVVIYAVLFYAVLKYVLL